MWLEFSNDTALRPQLSRVSIAKIAPPLAGVGLREARPLQSASVSTCLDRSSDGVRVVEQVMPMAPLQLAQYQHLQLKSRLGVLQSWEGVVVDIDDENSEFRARLSDLTQPGADDSEAVFDISDVSANDIDLLREGGVFQWLIGYRKHSYGQMERVSAIIFRRLPAWRAEDLEIAQAEGDALAAAFSID
jgi:hypothetical protein